MTLIVGVPCELGMLVAADRYGGRGKLYQAGSRLFATSHQTKWQAPDGTILFDVATLVTAQPPGARTIEELADGAVEMTSRVFWPRTDTEDDVALFVFWGASSTASFRIHNEVRVYRSPVETYRFDPSRWQYPIMQGMQDWTEANVIRAGRLSPESYSYLAAKPPGRRTALAAARAFALDVQSAVERAQADGVPHPGKIGGGVDLRLVHAHGVEVIS